MKLSQLLCCSLVWARQFTLVPDILSFVFRALETPPEKLEVATEVMGVSKRDVLLHLDKSLVVQCGQMRIDNGDCICDDRLTDLLVIQTNDSRAVVYLHEAANELVVAFRQTTTMLDWVTNAGARLVELDGHDGIKVHEGFLTQLNKIEGRVRLEIRFRFNPYIKNHYTLVISGYSMGGAMAMLFAVKNSQYFSFFKQVRVYTYASPRVGDEGFSRALNNLPFPVIRYTIHNDIVSLVPPRALGYRHGGVEFHSTPKGANATLKQCSLLYDEDPTCAFNLTDALEFSHFRPNNLPTPGALFCPEA